MYALLALLLTVGCTDSNPIAEFTGGGGGGGSASSSSSSGGGDDATADAGDDEASDDGAADAAPIEIGKTSSGGGTKLIREGNLTRPAVPDKVLTRKQCGDVTDGGPEDGPGCTTAELSCGDTIIGHTKGGGQYFDTRFYEKFYCTPATTNHNGGDERVYYLRSPEDRKRIWVTMDTPCADLDPAVIKYEGGGECPTKQSSGVNDCEMWPKSGNTREVVDVTSTGANDWLIVVEGKDDEEGAFGLTVQCMDW